MIHPVNGPALDCSTPVSREKAAAFRAAGFLGVVRAFAFSPTYEWAKPTPEELDAYRDAGLGVSLYAMWRSEGHTRETGLHDAHRHLSILARLDPHRELPVWVDLECHVTPSADNARAYAEALSEAYRADGRPLLAYYDRSYALSGANLDGLFDMWWQSGSRAELSSRTVWLPPAYVMRQRPGQTTVAGHPVDLNEAAGAPFSFDLSAKGWGDALGGLAASKAAFRAANMPPRDILPPPDE